MDCFIIIIIIINNSSDFLLNSLLFYVNYWNVFCFVHLCCAQLDYFLMQSWCICFSFVCVYLFLLKYDGTTPK